MADHREEVAPPARRDVALSAEEERIVKAVLAAMQRIRYGSIQITVQDGRAVQIDTLEKTRLAR